MPDVIVNASPLQYLHQIQQLDLLRAMYGRVIVPQGVRREIAIGVARGVDLPALDSLAWVATEIPDPHVLAGVPSALGTGEREVIALALERGGLAVLDDRAARVSAAMLGVVLTGTLGILVKAKLSGLLP
ncbi:MAG TPA: hypothetical protein VML55_08835, partial [Planctomycetaceae bacterium]|nr:hypothetical protein [Planctomycetaceae bacterium]